MKNSHAVIICIGFVLAAFVFGMFFYSSRATSETVSIVGAATMPIDSDIVKWRITLGTRTGLNDLNRGYEKFGAVISELIGTLEEKGLKKQDISVQPPNSYQSYDKNGQVSGYNLSQVVTVITAEIDVVERLALTPSELASGGVYLQNSSLEYFNSELDSIKLSLLADATKDARTRAERIATNSGVSLGKVKSLRAGVFQIREPYSTDVSAYGVYNTQSKDKEITVTVRASFDLN